MASGATIVVRFSRDGPFDGVQLSTATDYRISVNDLEWQAFRAPWDEDEFDEIIERLRHEDSQGRPNLEYLGEIGRKLGEAIGDVPELAHRLRQAVSGGATVYWRLDYPELARIPWELAAWWTGSQEHILLTNDISFVRAVPYFDPWAATTWPTGKDGNIKVLFAWGETEDLKVPWQEHLETLETLSRKHDVELKPSAIGTIEELGALCGTTRFDYVHLLAHGALTDNGEWGLQLGSERAKGRQLARALRQADSTPALVTLAACDSGNESNSQFGSVAYELHAGGIPMVVAAQFKLRKTVSNLSVARTYGPLFEGEHPLEALAGVRRQLSTQDNEAWSNEVVYTKYTAKEMSHGARAARQQAVLREARAIAKESLEAERTEEDTLAAVQALRSGIAKLEELRKTNFDPGETYGLLGSLSRRIAYLRSQPPDQFDLQDARDFYAKGLEQAYSSYCGINAIHLSCLLGGEEEKVVTELLPVVRFIAEKEAREARAERESGESFNYWAFATVGELGVYAGDDKAAIEGYREFIRAVRSEISDVNAQRTSLDSAKVQLQRLAEDRSGRATNSANRALEYLDNALDQLGPITQPQSSEEPEAATVEEQPTTVGTTEPAPATETETTPGTSAPAASAKPTPPNSAVPSSQSVYTVEMLPASLGDSLWIEYGTPGSLHRVLIDGGLVGTVDVIKAKILSIAAAEGRCHLELLVVTHIDGDHIEGIIKLLGEPDLPLDIDDVWFNGQKHHPAPGGEDEEEFLGARYGEFMSALIRERKLPWNQWRAGNTIYVPPEGRGPLPRHTLPGGLELTLLSPGYPELLKLSATWEEEIKKAKLDQADHEQVLEALRADRKLAPTDEFLAGQPEVAELIEDKKRSDSSRANGASIAFIADFAGRSCLFTGDAHWEVLTREIGRLLAERGPEERLPLTALKVPHHGSRNNLYDDLLERLDCRRFLISTDGSRFNHPDGAAVARLVGGPWRAPLGSDEPVDLYFNYRSDPNQAWDSDKLRSSWDYRTHYPEEGASGLLVDLMVESD